MTAPARRNACPTIARPMATGDGLLARLPPGPPLGAAQLVALVHAARRFGSGIVEVSARGSIQVRGLEAGNVAAFAAALAAAGLADARPAIHLPPLSGLSPDPSDMRPLADAIRAVLDADGLGPRLAPKASVVIDGPGRLHLDALDADLRLVADGDGVVLAAGGTAATARIIGTVRADHAVASARTTLRMLAALGPSARGRDLDPAAVATAIGARPGSAAAPRPAARPIGIHMLRHDITAVGVGLPFGQVECATLAVLIDAAHRSGAAAFAPAPGRALVVIGVHPDAVVRFRRAAAGLGFVISDSDPRHSVAACAGAPACASGRMPARAIARAITTAAAPFLDGSVTLHVSGCAKGCAHPGAATLALVGSDAGLAIAVDGRADAGVPLGGPSSDPAGAVARIARAVAGAHQPGDTSAVTLARLGTGGLIDALSREPVDA